MKSPFFSVIIPTLNEEKSLPRLLKALIAQTYQNYELIVVDGNSDDHTQQLFTRFKNRFQRALFITSDKRNVAYQRNVGASKSSGNFLVFFDADVLIGETFLEEIHIQILKRKLEFMTTWIEPDSDKNVDSLMILFTNIGMELTNATYKPFAPGYNIIIKRNVFWQLRGFREDVTISEDHDFAIRALEKNVNLTILKEPRLTPSLRRFRSEGTFSVLRKYIPSFIHMVLRGPITTKLFEYQMGGHVHKNKRKRVYLNKLRKYFKNLDTWQKKLFLLLEE